ncbi:hypothetical protein GCM10010954_14430 [Halobacillus andaensis]|uniref:Tyr recombinase domain-containing protein n=1 Tax=Halobacillus andaensis TaxID=1176239 RepID=A0A917B3T4_HALAA|nr:tyrosine-type recombinase/integrase [Halobacillus andaensis]MBP2004247.1 integrase [Halobacillus andaensis]GGF16873.1 hypothetical protein GCM10010954_14430 [Halobacillus andaensis]
MVEVTKKGVLEHLSARAFYDWCINDRFMLYFKIRPYDLRHAFTIMYLRNKGNAFSLRQKLMGHESIDMTKRYLNITGQDLREAHDKASPVNKLVAKKKSSIRKL